jgi:poly(A) polymerase
MLKLEKKPKWFEIPEVKQLMQALILEKLEPKFVGGCVRKTLLGKEVDDIDIAVIKKPETVMKLLKKHGIETVATGIKFGSIIAVINHVKFDITTLRADIKTDGRWAEVKYTTSLEEDAKRRDFTFNSIYLDYDGNLYDPNSGLKDLKERNVKFIGNAEKRVNEDYLRILRFFRFYSNVATGRPDSKVLDVCEKNSSLIKRLSGERIRSEFYKILESRNLFRTLCLMNVYKVLENVLAQDIEFEKIALCFKLKLLEKKAGNLKSIRKIFCLLGEEFDVRQISGYLKLSNEEKGLLKFYKEQLDMFEANVYSDIKDIEFLRYLYIYGKEKLADLILINAAFNNLKYGDISLLLTKVGTASVPKLPIKGRDVLELGLNGKAVGDILKKLEEYWIENGFKKNKKELIEKAKKFIRE